MEITRIEQVPGTERDDATWAWTLTTAGLLTSPNGHPTSEGLVMARKLGGQLKTDVESMDGKLLLLAHQTDPESTELAIREAAGGSDAEWGIATLSRRKLPQAYFLHGGPFTKYDISALNRHDFVQKAIWIFRPEYPAQTLVSVVMNPLMAYRSIESLRKAIESHLHIEVRT